MAVEFVHGQKIEGKAQFSLWRNRFHKEEDCCGKGLKKVGQGSLEEETYKSISYHLNGWMEKAIGNGSWRCG